MINFITIASLLVALGWVAALNIIVYPISKKLCIKISDYIVKTCAPRVFSILDCYKHFKFIGDMESKKLLPDQFIIISNHQSLIDIPLYMVFMPEKDLRFVAKDALGRHVPLVSEMLRAHEHCIIPRKGSPSVAMKELEKFGKRVIERHQIPVLFPEGTRSKDGSLGSFYAAGFRKLTGAAHLPVAVCALEGGWKINNLKNIFTNLSNGSYRVKVLKVYPAPETKEEQVKILDEAKVLIQNQLDEWRKA
ncbi:MAG: 1-acyl-sn-glycerol-3-phosphate acyltransferase [Treponema sp.]|nr:1-acyl-sn-glycerol-3-phosphate acyltransferase [Treponema sp.]